MAPIEFIPNAGACLVTTHVLSGDGRIQRMVREAAQNPLDNGWRIMSDIDADEHLTNTEYWRVADYNDVCHLEPALIDVWALPVGSDLHLFRDGGDPRIVDSATGRQVIPPAEGMAAAPSTDAHDVAKREDAIASETCTALSSIPDWSLALNSVTFTDGSPPASRCLLFAAGEGDTDLDRWFSGGVLPHLPYVAEATLPPETIAHLAHHRAAMPDASHRLWSTMDYAVQRDGQFYFFACRYR